MEFSPKIDFGTFSIGENKMQSALLDLFQASEDSPADTDTTMNALSQIQQNVNVKFFSSFEEPQIIDYFTSIWKFLLFAANSNNVTVRLSTYRTTGFFLLKNTPYFAHEITKSFSEVATQSTIEIKSSIILASSFAFICNLIPESFLQDFVENTPVFHHFTISDPVFSDHLATVISNLKRLEYDWMRSLLLTYLDVLDPQSERYLYKSISACVKNYKKQLFPEVLQYIYKKDNPSRFLSLLSYIFTSVQVDTKKLELSKLAEIIFSVLSDGNDHEQAVIDSSFHLLSLESNSFTTNFTLIDDKTLELQVKTTDKDLKCNISITEFNFMPSFYKMKLPFDMLQPKSNDALMIVPAKIITLSKYSKDHQEEYLNILDSFIIDRFDDKADAVCTSLSYCINSLEPSIQLAQLFTKIVFANQSSWFHSLNILKLIKAASISMVEKLIGSSKLLEMIDIIIELCFNANENVSSKSFQVLVKFIRDDDVNIVFQKLLQGIDLVDSNKISTTFKLLTTLMKSHPKGNRTYLTPLVDIACEYISLFKSDLQAIIVLMEFLSLFDLSETRPALISDVFYMVSSISHAAIEFYSGNAQTKVDPFFMQMVSNDLSSKNVDIISGTSLNYDSFLAPLLASLKLLLIIPRHLTFTNVILNIARQVVKIAPYQSSQLYMKYWNDLSYFDKKTSLQQLPTFIRLSNSKPTIANWCRLMIAFISEKQIPNEMTETRDCLGDLASNFLEHLENISDDQFIAFISYRSIFYFDRERIKELLNSLSTERRANIAKMMYDEDSKLYFRLFETKEPPSNIEQTIQSDQSDLSENIEFKLNYSADISKDYSENLSSPFIVTQLNHDLFEFKQQTLQSLFAYYCREDRTYSLQALVKYCMKRKILLSIKNVLIPNDFALIVIKYLSSLNSDEVEAYTTKVLNDTKSRDIAQEFARIKKDEFINFITSGEIRKRTLLFAAMNMQEGCEFQSNSLTTILSAEVSNDTTPKRFCTAISLAILMLTYIKEITQEFANSVLSSIQKREDIPLYIAARFYLAYANKFALSPEFVEHIKKLIPLLMSSTNAKEHLVMTLLKTDPELSNSQYYNTLCNHFIESDRPSIVINGIKMIEHIITINETRLDYALKENLFRILMHSTDFRGTPFILSAMSSFLSNVLMRTQCITYHRTIVREFVEYFPEPADAAVNEIIEILPKIMKVTENGFDYNKKLTDYYAKLATVPLNKQFVDVTLETMKAEIKRGSYDVDVIMTMANKFIQNFNGFEDYTKLDILVDLMKFLFSSLSSGDALLVICTNIFNAIPKFSIFFRCLCRVLYERNDEAEFVQASAWLCGVIRIRCHKAAAACIAEKSKMELLLKISDFENDCPESERLLKDL